MSEYKRKALVLGAGGFIGSHMVKRLRSEGYWVRGVDLKYPEFSSTQANEFIRGDLRDVNFVRRCIRFTGYLGNFYQQISDKFSEPFDEIYQFAADMGGAGFVFTGENDADIMHNSVSINLNVLEEQSKLNVDKGVNKTKIFYSGSACMYPEHNQLDPNNPNCREESAYPANPDSEYGWEKLFSERLYFAYHRNYDIPVRVARYHNIFGPCFDKDTEVLTEDGWKFFENLNDNDKIASLIDGKLEYQNFIAKQKYWYDGEMYRVSNRSVDQLVTPDHKLYVSSRTTKTINKNMVSVNTEFGLKEAKNIKWDIATLYFTSYFDWDGQDMATFYEFPETLKEDGRKLHPSKIINMKDWFEFVGWYLSEGSMFKTPSNHTVCITQYQVSNSKKREDIKNLLERMEFNFSEDKLETQVIISNKQVYETLMLEGIEKGSTQKSIPRWMLSAKKEYLQILYDSMMKGDGNKTGRRYTTTSKKLCDDFCELSLKLGKNVNVKTVPSNNSNHSTIYRINICDRVKSDTSRENRWKENYSGYVYDVTLPKGHVLMIRRNGKHCWSGNCGTWEGGREKAPAAICRKVAYLPEEGGSIEVWGDGLQTRSFLFIDECIEATRRLMDSNFMGPVNIGSEEMVTINELVDTAARVAGKEVHKIHIDGPLGVRGRNSNNDLIREKLGWDYSQTLEEGIRKTYSWINSQILNSVNNENN